MIFDFLKGFDEKDEINSIFQVGIERVLKWIIR